MAHNMEQCVVRTHKFRQEDPTGGLNMLQDKLADGWTVVPGHVTRMCEDNRVVEYILEREKED